MQKKNRMLFWVVLVTCLTLSGCDAIQGRLQRVKNRFFGGEKTENAESLGSRTEEGESPVVDLVKRERSEKKISQMTPEKKVYELCRAYQESHDEKMKMLFLSEFVRNKTYFATENLDEGLQNCLLGLRDNIQTGDEGVIEILSEVYRHLRGKNQQVVFALLGETMEKMPERFFEKLGSRLDFQECVWGTMSTVNASAEEKQALVLNRRTILLGILKNYENQPVIKHNITACLVRIDPRLARVPASVAAAVEPSPTASPAVNEIQGKEATEVPKNLGD